MELRRVLLSIASLLAGCIAAGVRAQAPVERSGAADTATPGVFGPRVMAAGSDRTRSPPSFEIGSAASSRSRHCKPRA